MYGGPHDGAVYIFREPTTVLRVAVERHDQPFRIENREPETVSTKVLNVPIKLWSDGSYRAMWKEAT